jgi:hypothetical protein
MKNRNTISTTILLALTCFAPLPTVQAVFPLPDGGYPNGNTAEGTNALFLLTSGTDNTANGFEALFKNTTGGANTATGYKALFSNTTAEQNTATGSQALFKNTTGENNTATGDTALFSNTTGYENTAVGQSALYHNTTGYDNTASGWAALSGNTIGHENTATGSRALPANTTGYYNTADGAEALWTNTTGHQNTADGAYALSSNTTGQNNTATGAGALFSNTFGSNNTAIGVDALSSNTGSNNTALGFNAGSSLTGINNIDIGYNVQGLAGESNTIRIGDTSMTSTYIRGISGATASGGATVFVKSDGRLGTLTSSARFKDEIKPMDKASEAILALRPVSFRYKKDIDPQGVPQFGLVAEEVEKVNPDLVIRDAKGNPQTVRYEQINAMLLNEFLKEHKKVEEQQSKIESQTAAIVELRSIVAQQQKGTEILTAQLKEQADQIQRVSAQLEVRKARSAVVRNDR